MTLFTKGEKGDLTTQIFQIFSGKEVRVWVVASGNLAGLRATPLHPLTIPPHRDSEITGSSEPLSYTFQYFRGRCSVSKLYPTPCDPMDCSTPGFSVLHCLLEFAQTHVHWVGDAIQTSHPLSSPSPPALSLSQHQGLFEWVSSLCQVGKVLKLHRQSFEGSLI